MPKEREPISKAYKSRSKRVVKYIIIGLAFTFLSTIAAFLGVAIFDFLAVRIGPWYASALFLAGAAVCVWNLSRGGYAMSFLFDLVAIVFAVLWIMAPVVFALLTLLLVVYLIAMVKGL